jgi:A nuclease family of the HNH/ENDO VII superfamily with conserved AHH
MGGAERSSTMAEDHQPEFNLKELHTSDDPTGCLGRHEYVYAAVSEMRNGVNHLKEGPCNHRWQGYLRASVEDPGDYNHRNWRWYGQFLESNTRKRYRRVVVFPSNGRMIPRQFMARRPKPGEWNIGGADRSPGATNYRTTCNRPFWHEAHHIIPNGSFKNAIVAVGKGTDKHSEYTHEIKRGLMTEKYNLNNKVNMIILPIVSRIAKAIGLPMHVDRLGTTNVRHTSYSDHVEQRLDEIFGPIEKTLEAHEKPAYKDCRSDLERFSGTLRTEIKSLGKTGQALDELFAPTEGNA